jgi:hypothetical protein
MRNSEKQQPWWLESGHDPCPSCGHTFVLETSYYCTSCDIAICSICVEEATSVLCSVCKQWEGETANVGASNLER